MSQDASDCWTEWNKSDLRSYENIASQKCEVICVEAFADNTVLIVYIVQGFWLKCLGKKKKNTSRGF